MGGASGGGKAGASGGVAAAAGATTKPAVAKKVAVALPPEDPSTQIPCPVTTAHPNGFVERTEPNRETHEVR